MDSVSEKINPISGHIAMAGLISPIIKILALRQDNRFRSGRLSKAQKRFVKLTATKLSIGPRALAQHSGETRDKPQISQMTEARELMAHLVFQLESELPRSLALHHHAHPLAFHSSQHPISAPCPSSKPTESIWPMKSAAPALR